MKRATHPRPHGFTLIEVLVTVAVAGTGLAAALSLFGSSDELAAQSKRRLAASAHYREAHKAIARELRNADITTLSGFDVDGVAAQPRFQHVTGMSGDDLTHGPQCMLKFEAVPPALPGVGNVGNLVLVRTGLPTEVVVRQVVANTFQVRQEGRNLVIRLRIYDGPNDKNLTTVQGETVVSVRN